MARQVTKTPPQFNLTPTPRILNMLGEINLEWWRCIGEIIDNSVDGFLAAHRAGIPIGDPRIEVVLPTQADRRGQISVIDNGPGMDEQTLEKAVKAGWSSRNPMDGLGLYGMGFNIATARLGTVTTIWTSRAGDPQEVGLTIDFQELMRKDHFSTPRLYRPKEDPAKHGTTVTVEKLKDGALDWFAKSANKARVRAQLSRAYSPMLRAHGKPITFDLRVNAAKVEPYRHSIWGGPGNPDRIVQTKQHGPVASYEAIDLTLAPRNFCSTCIQWLGNEQTLCPVCEKADNVSLRTRRIHGWLGIQTYLDESDYGIDFVRMGRKIEMANKEFFTWHNEGREEEEYPIDDPRRRGRIVGEIHLDHCRVNYAKDRFDRADGAWKEMEDAVRGEAPLRPNKATELGFQLNQSPLARLVSGFRRSNPGGGKSEQAGAWEKILVVADNVRAKDLAEKMRQGDPRYQGDKAWWDLLKSEEASRLAKKPTGIEDSEEGPLPGFAATAPAATAANAPVAPPPPHPRTADVQLTRAYTHAATALTWDVKAYSSRGNPDLGKAPWSLLRNSVGDWEFVYDPQHDAFQSSTLMPLDGLLAHLAYLVADSTTGSARETGYGTALSDLRAAYASHTRVDASELIQSAQQCLQEAAAAVVGQLDAAEAKDLFGELDPVEQRSIMANMASRSVGKPQQLIESGRFLEHAPPAVIASFFRNNPELFLDGKVWPDEYSAIAYDNDATTAIARGRIVDRYAGLLADAVWLAEANRADIQASARPRVLRARHALELLAPVGEPE